MRNGVRNGSSPYFSPFQIVGPEKGKRERKFLSMDLMQNLFESITKKHVNGM